MIGERPESRGFGDSLLCNTDKGFGVELEERPQRTKVATGLLEEQRAEFSLLSGEGERMLAKVPGEDYSKLRGREGEPITITWKEEDVQLLRK